MSNGIQISKDGRSITAGNKEERYVDVDTPFFKLYKSDSGNQYFTGGVGEQHDIVIKHNLGYRPFLLFFMDRNPGLNRRMVTSRDSSPVNLPSSIFATIAEITATDFTVRVQSQGSVTGAFGYNYYIYKDKIA